jgi:hypothetical protein
MYRHAIKTTGMSMFADDHDAALVKQDATTCNSDTLSFTEKWSLKLLSNVSTSELHSSSA